MTGVVIGEIEIESPGIMIHLFSGTEVTINGKPYTVREESTRTESQGKITKAVLEPGWKP